MFVEMCPESKNPLFSQIYFEHGYLPHFDTYLHENLYTHF